MKCKYCETEMDYLESKRTCSECKYCRPYCYDAQINDWLFVCVKAKKQPAIIGDSMTICFTSNHVCQANN